ncbi:ABC transporter permease [Pseudogracilibacillus auburnensis]|uniref:Peptide/nickel transport system permease protein n=1 Tax=Pseudogracilibacillus auburnensis TaxID=1494959 RepID=A0A2V3VWC5_9BACI|nr:ABC transporter permease [Pseudogracilibacillus auburnensis]MBO1002363.1 ABC transporter permease [Pseudogracilibacillus auburnensis]PXW86247.1 peptide/nickel transport system permease protein [Pseudogracilibacillus auburnensis]
MFNYIIKRILSLIPVLFIVSIAIFLLIHITPGDPASIILGIDASQEQIDELRQQLGLDLPVYEQYIRWILGVFQGDFGTSYFSNEPVTTSIIEHLKPTISLAILAQIITIIIAIPLGIAAANRRGTVADQSIMGVSLLGMSIPSFLLGLFLILFFGVKLGWLPVAGYQPLEAGFFTHLKYLIMPAISLGAIQAALVARMTRTSMLEVLNTNYIKTAQAKGVKNRSIVYKHALRNAFLPILTVIGQTFGILIAGAVVTETIFNIPGIGQLIINSVERRDYAVIQGVVLFVTLSYVFINLVIDLLYGLIDPRVRLDND